MYADATILHADLDAFYASVEQRDDPALRGRPVIVGGGVVLAASYEAKRRGVRTATGIEQARRACPGAIVVPPRMDAYAAASRQVFAVFEETAPVVEALSIDEAFLDVAGTAHFAGAPREVAERLRAAVRQRTGLPITVGVARTKFVAKIASAQAKPDGLLVVPPGGELDFLHPLPVEALWGVGKVTAKRLHALGLRTVGDIARRDEAALRALLGEARGRHLHALANNRDPRKVRPRARRRSIGAQRAFRRGEHRPADLDTMLVGLVARVGRRLRKSGRAARTVSLHLRFDDFSRATRAKTLAAPTAQEDALLAAARALLAAAMPLVEARGATLVGVALENLETEVQLELPLDAESAAVDEVEAAVDAVRDRFGKTSIKRARLIGRDEGIAVPTLPD